MSYTQDLILQSTIEQRERFFKSILWKDIEAVVANYRLRELEIMANPRMYEQEEVSVDWSRGRLEILGGLCATLKMVMCDDLLNDENGEVE